MTKTATQTAMDAQHAADSFTRAINELINLALQAGADPHHLAAHLETAHAFIYRAHGARRIGALRGTGEPVKAAPDRPDLPAATFTVADYQSGEGRRTITAPNAILAAERWAAWYCQTNAEYPDALSATVMRSGYHPRTYEIETVARPEFRATPLPPA